MVKISPALTEWASLYLISTFPSCRYDIELYPALKNHLLSFGKNKLEQTGKEYIINGEKIKARKKTSNKWFETQDSISYWEDFSKPVIAWQRITAKNQFCLTEAGTIILDSMAFLSHLGAYGNYLLAILNSDLIHFWIKKSVHEYGSTGFRLSNQYVELIPVPVPNESELSIANTLIELYLQGKKSSDEINKFVYTLYGITSEETITINKIIDASESQ